MKIPQTLVKIEENNEDVETVDKLIVGDNAINVTNGYWGTSITFTAPAEGVYVLTAAEGETNACIIIEDLYGTEIRNMTSPYVFEMAEGEVKTFIVATLNSASDIINLVISQ